MLLDRNNLTGSLGPVCALNDGKLSLATADCQEVVCVCCNPCCADQISQCHDYDLVPSMDPLWEFTYERQVYDFGADGVIYVGDDN
jgi:hypothetical protein